MYKATYILCYSGIATRNIDELEWIASNTLLSTFTAPETLSTGHDENYIGRAFVLRLYAAWCSYTNT